MEFDIVSPNFNQLSRKSDFQGDSIMQAKGTLFTLLALSTTAFVALQFCATDSGNPRSQTSKSKLKASFAKQEAKKDHNSLISKQAKGAGEYFAAKRLAKGMPLPTKNYTQAIQAKREFFNQQNTKSADDWQSLGPQQVGGRTRSFVFHPENPDIMYSGGVSGGVWKSTDGGSSWLPLTDDMENLAVVTLAIMPDSPNTIIAGTGEGVYIGRPIVRSRGVEGNGIYRSTDDGENWQAIGNTLDNPDFRFVNKIRVSQDSTLFAATEKGIWRSTDIGDSWQLVLDQSSRVGGCHEIEIQPSSAPNNILASCGSFESAAVYQSTNSGDSWAVVIEEEFQGRTTLAFAPSNPNRVYALSAQNQFGPFTYGLNGLYRSDDGGTNWTEVANTNSANLNSRSLLSTTNYVFDCSATGQYQDGRLAGGGWYYNLITVDPTNPDRIWTGGLDLWRSDDGGVNFGLASFWWADRDANSYIHGDHHSIVFHPNYNGASERRMFASNDGGLWQTENSTASLATNNCDDSTSQISWSTLNNNYAVTQFYHGSVSRDGRTLIGGSQDNGSIYRDSNGQWSEILGGDGSYSAIDPKDSSTVYVSSQYANLYRVNVGQNTNDYIYIGEEFDAPGLFITPFIIDPNDNNRLWFAGLALWRSDDQGDNWQKVSRDEYNMNYIDGLSALATQPGNSNLTLAGGTDGTIYRHTSALTGSSSLVMQSTKIADGYISAINFDRNNPNKVVATVSTFGQLHAWLSTDAGVSWQAIDQVGSAGLPDLPAHDIIVAPHDTNTLYVSTDIGVYISENNGADWQPLASGLPNVPVEKIVHIRHELQSSLYAFSYGRGAFKTNLTDITNQAPTVTEQVVEFNVTDGERIELDLNQYFDDQNDDLLIYTASGLPSGLSINVSGNITGVVAATAEEPVTSIATVVASDSELEVSKSISFNVSNPPESSSSGGGSLYLLISFLLLLSFKRMRES